ncbi:hypothetical protein [Shewanella sp. UCD-KL12]|uniref:hypothetical protein n=1 Tax=Shewanella sp. UCD-KL12 TaxID=1917163 RepID=UPI0009705DA8|nr:hypothetical protein [Shewanella sp. UCD-KL12]
MTSKFKEISKALSLSFDIPVTTLNKWATSENRVAHRQIMEQAHQAINELEQYSALTSSNASLEEVAKSLGFDNPLTMHIEGISSRTFRSWFENEDKRKLVIGFLIGMHWGLLSEATMRLEISTPVKLHKKLKAKDVMPGEFVRLYQISPISLVKLMK